MKNSKQILEFLSSTRSFEYHNNQQLDLNVLEIERAFDLFIKRLNNCDSSSLSKSIKSMIKILNRMPIFYFTLVLSQIDETFPGLSFHYVMEARQSDDIENIFFIKRLQGFKQNNLLNEIFASLRVNLITGLLEQKETEYENQQNLIKQINNSFNLSLEQITSIKDILHSSSVKKSTFNLPLLPVLCAEDILFLLNSTLNEKE